MATILSNIQGLIERTVYKALRAVTEEHLYIPDITDYPNTQNGFNDYNDAVKDVVADKGYAIEVFGHSNAQAKGQKLVPRIVIKPRRVIEGGIGMDVGKLFKLNAGDASFTSYTVQGTSSNIHIEVHLVSNTAAQHRILHSIMMAALNHRGYLELYDNSAKFFYRYIGYSDEENVVEGILTNVYTYEVVDVDMMQEVIVDAATAKILEITFEMYTGTYFPTSEFEPGDFTIADSDIIT